MACCCCSNKAFATIVTLVTISAFVTLLYFAYYDLDFSTFMDKATLHAISGIFAVIGAILCVVAIHCLYKEQYDSWGGSIIGVYVPGLLVALFELKIILAGIFLGATLAIIVVISIFSSNYTEPNRFLSIQTDIEERQPIVVVGSLEVTNVAVYT